MSEHLDFSLSLHHALAPARDRGFCWSPYSVASALGLAAAAAGGDTRRELATALRLRETDDLTGLLETLDGAARLGRSDREDGPKLAVANTLWTHEDLPVEESYLKTLADWPGNAVRHAPFRADPDGARRTINADVAETTRELIPELLPEGTVDAETVAALVNALYLKVSWAEAFTEGSTSPQPFEAPNGQREVPTMRAERRSGYAHQDGWQVATVPAAGGVEAVVLLPDDDLVTAEPQLTPRRLEQLLAARSPRKLDLWLPKFEATGDAELERSLSALGVERMFTPAADFTPLTSEPLKVSSVMHQSVLRIDEAGLEGAAATAVMMRLTSVDTTEPVTFRIDRPFLFLVRHRDTGALYFVARVVDPG